MSEGHERTAERETAESRTTPRRSWPALGTYLVAALLALQGGAVWIFSFGTGGGWSELFYGPLGATHHAAVAALLGVSALQVAAALLLLCGVRRGVSRAASVLFLLAGAALMARELAGPVPRLPTVFGAAIAAVVLAGLAALVARNSRRPPPEPRAWRGVVRTVEIALTGALLGFLVLMGVGFLGPDRSADPPALVEAELPARAFTVELASADGETRPIHAAGTQATVVNYWATWCVPCIRELPDLVEAADRLAAEDVSVVLVNVDAASVDQVATFLERREIDLGNGAVASLLDADGVSWDPVSEATSETLPTTVVLDDEASAVGHWIGARDADAIVQETILALGRARRAAP